MLRREYHEQHGGAFHQGFHHYSISFPVAVKNA